MNYRWFQSVRLCKINKAPLFCSTSFPRSFPRCSFTAFSSVKFGLYMITICLSFLFLFCLSEIALYRTLLFSALWVWRVNVCTLSVLRVWWVWAFTLCLLDWCSVDFCSRLCLHIYSFDFAQWCKRFTSVTSPYSNTELDTTWRWQISCDIKLYVYLFLV